MGRNAAGSLRLTRLERHCQHTRCRSVDQLGPLSGAQGCWCSACVVPNRTWYACSHSQLCVHELCTAFDNVCLSVHVCDNAAACLPLPENTDAAGLHISALHLTQPYLMGLTLTHVCQADALKTCGDTVQLVVVRYFKVFAPDAQALHDTSMLKSQIINIQTYL